MRILSLDASTVAIGYCVLDVKPDTVSHIGVHKPKGKELDVRMFDAYYWLKAWLDTPLNADVLAIELPVLASWTSWKTKGKRRKSNPATTIKLAQMVGVLCLAAYPFIDRIVRVMPSERLVVLGLPGNMRRDPAKANVMRLVNERYGLSITCDDESDAVAIALAAVRKMRRKGMIT